MIHHPLARAYRARVCLTFEAKCPEANSAFSVRIFIASLGSPSASVRTHALLRARSLSGWGSMSMALPIAARRLHQSEKKR